MIGPRLAALVEDRALPSALRVAGLRSLANARSSVFRERGLPVFRELMGVVKDPLERAGLMATLQFSKDPAVLAAAVEMVRSPELTDDDRSSLAGYLRFDASSAPLFRELLASDVEDIWRLVSQSIRYQEPAPELKAAVLERFFVESEPYLLKVFSEVLGEVGREDMLAVLESRADDQALSLEHRAGIRQALAAIRERLAGR